MTTNGNKLSPIAALLKASAEKKRLAALAREAEREAACKPQLIDQSTKFTTEEPNHPVQTIIAISEQTTANSKIGLSAIDMLRAKMAAKKLDKTEQTAPVITESITDISEEIYKETVSSYSAPQGDTARGMSGELITYNKEQQEFINLAGDSKSCVLIGAAGTGKTTCSQGGIKALMQSSKISPLDPIDHKHLRAGGPGIIIVSYTRRAVNNIRKVQSEDMKHNCITVHKLLEYQPEYFEVYDPETGTDKRTMRFCPSRNSSNPLPASIHTIIVEEASMLSLELFTELTEALTHEVQWIFIGDIQQLPPVFGSAILGFKMLELPVIELTQVYRQALESPIIRLAHRILSGKAIPVEEYPEWKDEGKLTLHPWKKKLNPEHAALTLAAFYKAAIDKNIYDPEEDMILIPYNKACGTIELNAQIANHLARKRQAITYEVMAGFNKHYFSVGDRVLYDREDAEIISIEPNPTYAGTKVQAASKNLDYWGHNPKAVEEYNIAKSGAGGYDILSVGMDVDAILDQVASDSEERVTQASHKLVIRLLDTASEITITKAAEVNSLLLSYALTVHKSQGSEWRKVFLALHQSHASMLQRELLYTAVTRAREELYVICEPESFTKGILSQRITGETLEEKAEFFKGKL